jgi:hypothetical protein
MDEMGSEECAAPASEIRELGQQVGLAWARGIGWLGGQLGAGDSTEAQAASTPNLRLVLWQRATSVVRDELAEPAPADGVTEGARHLRHCEALQVSCGIFKDLLSQSLQQEAPAYTPGQLQVSGGSCSPDHWSNSSSTPGSVGSDEDVGAMEHVELPLFDHPSLCPRPPSRAVKRH